MESLYRKYRPLTFDSVVGQQHIVSTLEHAISEGRLSHAYLFCGPRGTGKTTMARILAKALLCHESDAARASGASGCMPDGTCEECELIAEGNHPDVYELDAASRTGVDNVREEIINSVNFAPVRGKYKVYIIDEVHMLTTAAFNALLKTLEEPPAHVVFVLCTTDPQKILETILSRCQRFDFHRIGNEDIEGRLRYVCEQEGFEYDDEAIRIVARHARGGMRDALSTLEQLSVFGAGAVRASDARSLLGEVAGSVLADFAHAIAQRDVVALFGLIRAQVNEGNDLLELTRDLVAHVRDVYMVRVAGARPELFEYGSDELAVLDEEAKAFDDADRLARVLTVLDDASLEMRNASDARLVLEIACTRLARPEADLTVEALAERLARLEAQVAAGPVAGGLSVAGGDATTAAIGAATTKGDAVGASAGRTAAAAAGATASSSKPSAPAVSAARTSAHGGAPWERPTAAGSPAPTASAASTQGAARKSDSAGTGQIETDSGARKVASGAVSAASKVSPNPVSAASKATSGTTAPAVATASSATPSAAVTPAVTDEGELQRKWFEVIDRVKAAKASCVGLLRYARAQSDDGSTLVVAFPAGAGSNFAISMLGRADTQSIVLPAVNAVFGQRAVSYIKEGDAAAPQSGEPSPAVPSSAPAASAAPAAAPATAPTSQTAPTPAPDRPAPQQKANSASGKDGVLPAKSNAVLGSGRVPSGPSSPTRASASRPPWESASKKTAAVAFKSPTVSRAKEPAVSAPEQVFQPVGGSVASAVSKGPAASVAQEPSDIDQVPYDDAEVSAYDDLPPFDVPVDVPVDEASQQVSPAPVPWGVESQEGAPTEPVPSPAAPASGGSSPKTASAAASPLSGSPFGHAGAAPVIPQTEDEAKELIREVFGAGTIFKSVQ